MIYTVFFFFISILSKWNLVHFTRLYLFRKRLNVSVNQWMIKIKKYFYCFFFVYFVSGVMNSIFEIFEKKHMQTHTNIIKNELHGVQKRNAFNWIVYYWNDYYFSKNTLLHWIHFTTDYFKILHFSVFFSVIAIFWWIIFHKFFLCSTYLCPSNDRWIVVMFFEVYIIHLVAMKNERKLPTRKKSNNKKKQK